MTPDPQSGTSSTATSAVHHLTRLENVVRHYAWGSRTAIPDLLGTPPDGRPHAELWVGAHPDAPSTLTDGRTLDEAIRTDPHELLGADLHARHGARLPFLLKVLAADAPLSIQVHPDAARAAARFAAERDADLPATERSYTDPHHKPEMLLALTRFEALCGLREADEVRRDLDDLDLPDRDRPALARLVAALERPGPGATRDAVARLLADAGARHLVADVVDAARRRSLTPHDAVLPRLAAHHPDDPGVLVALLMQHLVLEPGEALYLSAGVLHAYLGGVGVEVMASSDNVLRAGLTAKRLDVAELLEVLEPGTAPVRLVEPEVVGRRRTWRPGPTEFELHLVDVDDTAEFAPGGPRVVLCLDGRVDVVATSGDGPRLPLAGGTTVFAPDSSGPLTFEGSGTVVLARAVSARAA
ncbi:mannose-6-phosphate isomerase, class I [Angustibacter speluncae]